MFWFPHALEALSSCGGALKGTCLLLNPGHWVSEDLLVMANGKEERMLGWKRGAEWWLSADSSAELLIPGELG